jgi:5-methylcytosine-specific restriction endonuclease McrA
MSDQIPKANRQIVQGRAFGRCERCLKATLCGDHHHRRVRGMGGSKASDRHDPSNLVWLCRSCHDWAHDNPQESTAAGFIVPRSSGNSPLQVPITDLAGQTRFLDNRGQYLLNEPEGSDV